MSLKLYILVRADMSPEQQAVQAGHAVAYFCETNIEYNLGWKNGTLIYLSVEDAEELDKFDNKLNVEDNHTGMFYDPDLHEGPTALFAYGPDCEELFKDLPLMKFE